MAIGDGENDIEMLKLAGWGVAMGNANSVVKGVAKAITSTNDEDGVAEAIEQYILWETFFGKPYLFSQEIELEVSIVCEET